MTNCFSVCHQKVFLPAGGPHIEHSYHRADGDVVAEQADGFDKFCFAELLFHPFEQFVGQLMMVHQRAGELHQQSFFSGEFVGVGMGTQRFDRFRLDANFGRANFVARPGIVSFDFARGGEDDHLAVGIGAAVSCCESNLRWRRNAAPFPANASAWSTARLRRCGLRGSIPDFLLFRCHGFTRGVG